MTLSIRPTEMEIFTAVIQYYQLSLINPHDGILLYRCFTRILQCTEVDAQFDQLITVVASFVNLLR